MRLLAPLAIEYGLRPILTGRNADKLKKLAAKLGVDAGFSICGTPQKIEQALKDVTVVLHCAGPYLYTSKPMVEACLRTGTDYLDLTGEIPVYEALAAP